MKLGDIYVNKKDKSIIQIDSYATHMGNFPEKSIVVFRQMEKHNELFGSLPSFNGYGSREEIEEEYELLVPQEKLQNYSDSPTYEDNTINDLLVMKKLKTEIEQLELMLQMNEIFTEKIHERYRR